MIFAFRLECRASGELVESGITANAYHACGRKPCVVHEVDRE